MNEIISRIARDGDNNKKSAVIYTDLEIWDDAEGIMIDFMEEATELFKRVSEPSLREIWDLKRLILEAFGAQIDDEKICRFDETVFWIRRYEREEDDNVRIECYFYERNYSKGGEKPE